MGIPCINKHLLIHVPQKLQNLIKTQQIWNVFFFIRKTEEHEMADFLDKPDETSMDQQNLEPSSSKKWRMTRYISKTKLFLVRSKTIQNLMCGLSIQLHIFKLVQKTLHKKSQIRRPHMILGKVQYRLVASIDQSANLLTYHYLIASFFPQLS